MLHDAFFISQSVQRLWQVIRQFLLIQVRIVFSVQLFQILDFFNVAVAHVRSEVEVERRNGLSSVHFVLCSLQGDTTQDASGFNAFGRARFSVSGREPVLQDVVQRMLHASQTLGRVIILVMDVQVILADSFQYFIAQQIVVNKRLGSLAGKLHHHAGRSVGVHVGVFAGNVIRFDVDDLQEHIARFCLAGNAALVAVSYILLGYVFTAALHQFQFNQILDGFHCHL